MGSKMTGRKRVAASVAATALLAGGMAFAAPGAASAAPVMGSADAVTDFVNGIGLWTPAVSEGVNGPEVTVTPNPNGTVGLKMEQGNPTGTCLLAIVPALDTPPDGIASAEVRETAVYSMAVGQEDGGIKEVNTDPLDPGLYAVVSHCAVLKEGDTVHSRTANQPHFFATLGTLGEMS